MLTPAGSNPPSIIPRLGLKVDNFNAERIVGMLEPHLATMFCFLATDAMVAADALPRALKRAADASLNRITVDGDQSTSDTVALLANGLAENAPLERGSRGLREFARGVHPSILREEGLDAAIDTLARRAPLPVDVSGTVGARLPDPVELAAYFFVSEALTNVGWGEDGRTLYVTGRTTLYRIRLSARGATD